MFDMSKELIMKECPTDMCHASTILRLRDESFLCAWFGGSHEGLEDVGIWLSKRTDGLWSKPVMITTKNVAHWNPVLFQLEKDKIIMFYKVGAKIKNWKTMTVVSDDGGMTWSEPEPMKVSDSDTCDITGRGPVRNKPIRLSNGRILAPASIEDGIWSAYVDISDDDAITWRKTAAIQIRNVTGDTHTRTVAKGDTNIPVSEQSFFGRGVIQPTLWESTQGNVHMLLRSTEGRIFRSDSLDYGDTWCDAYETELPNNNSGIDLVKIADNTLLLVYNPVGKNWGERTPISLAMSVDNAVSWKRIADLDEGEGEFSYPAIITDGDNAWITYTWKRENIAFWQV